jgi:hypothetical protein
MKRKRKMRKMIWVEVRGWGLGPTNKYNSNGMQNGPEPSSAYLHVPFSPLPAY